MAWYCVQSFKYNPRGLLPTYCEKNLNLHNPLQGSLYFMLRRKKLRKPQAVPYCRIAKYGFGMKNVKKSYQAD